jgi:hypothetical protein
MAFNARDYLATISYYLMYTHFSHILTSILQWCCSPYIESDQIPAAPNVALHGLEQTGRSSPDHKLGTTSCFPVCCTLNNKNIYNNTINVSFLSGTKKKKKKKKNAHNLTA